MAERKGARAVKEAQWQKCRGFQSSSPASLRMPNLYEPPSNRASSQMELRSLIAGVPGCDCLGARTLTTHFTFTCGCTVQCFAHQTAMPGKRIEWNSKSTLPHCHHPCGLNLPVHYGQHESNSDMFSLSQCRFWLPSPPTSPNGLLH